MAYEDLARSAAVRFFIRYKDKQFAQRRMFRVPRVGDICVFDEVRYRVEVVMLCDWKAATLRTKNGDIRKSLEIQRERFGLSEQIVAIMANTIPLLEGHNAKASVAGTASAGLPGYASGDKHE